jgi:ribonuclease R
MHNFKKIKKEKIESKTYTGTVDMLASGSMYIRPDEEFELEEDIFVDSYNGNHALDGDRVEVVVTRKKRGGRLEGEVVRVLERNRRNYVGILDVTEHAVFVRPDTRKMPVDIYIRRSTTATEETENLSEKTAKPELKNGQKVVVKIVDWQEGSKCPVGEIVDILGEAGNNDAEMHAIMAEFDLPYRFEPGVEQAADAIPGKITAAEIKRRRDFRKITTFTIDPEDAKDFDDALSIRRLNKGAEEGGAVWEIGVHIADVTHYVSPGSVVDTEGESRATSVYLVDRTIPMLPEKLSNNLCSLRPEEEKLCFSAVFEMDENLDIHKEWFGRTVIRSDRRFTYEEAQKIIETGEGDFKAEVLKLNELAQAMRKVRFAKGAITFDREEFKFRLDSDGKPLGVYRKEMKESNQLIEEFMLLANKRVAEFVGKNRETGKKSGRTFV